MSAGTITDDLATSNSREAANNLNRRQSASSHGGKLLDMLLCLNWR